MMIIDLVELRFRRVVIRRELVLAQRKEHVSEAVDVERGECHDGGGAGLSIYIYQYKACHGKEGEGEGEGKEVIDYEDNIPDSIGIPPPMHSTPNFISRPGTVFLSPRCTSSSTPPAGLVPCLTLHPMRPDPDHALASADATDHDLHEEPAP